jgi:hypothetical protein
MGWVIIIPKLPKTPKGWYSTDVKWYIPKQKSPIAYSTVATMDLIVLLSEEGLTIKEIFDKIMFDDEGKKVLSEYIKRGYGNTIAKSFFK